ncbi:replication initiation protein [Chimaeribacter arupi]|uniref:Replication initiation protein n=2 Tax=Yersiniaceae TaxID=1903411 RepID=A0A2N5ENL8_9GAMM|nr:MULTISPECIES: replication initiation protein [Yersiniaceae]MBS0969520.1 replication initiation protein [Nissabacter archeti]MDV5140289.1 replication initiation protein [Chimaeribacter arupi]PLR30568.1 replication initiation protein [Chimaeribacter arupi]PLR47607.1 replication initiation protein [Chimaeribacter arupi]PLR50266.1 replication initiation protein [Chimaeribacter arupi]
MAKLDVKKLYVTQDNKLLEGAYSATLDEMRLLYLALVQIDSKKVQPDGLYTLYPADFEKMFGVHPSHTHQQLKKAADSLGSKPIITYEWDEKKKRLDKVKRFWFSSIRYDASDNTADVTIRFSPDVVPYLYDLKKEFTQVDFEHVSRLDTPFAFRLYSWLVKFRNLARNSRQNGIIETDPFEIDWMKERTGLVGKYEEYRFFKRDVLVPAIERINANTDISVSWQPVKVGRSVTAIKFFYVIESGQRAAKPLRPRLPRRPHAVAGSDLEGKWARRCISLMKEYRQKLEAFDASEKITLADLRKWLDWYTIIGDAANIKLLQAEIKKRSTRKKAA